MRSGCRSHSFERKFELRLVCPATVRGSLLRCRSNCAREGPQVTNISLELVLLVPVKSLSGPDHRLCDRLFMYACDQLMYPLRRSSFPRGWKEATILLLQSPHLFSEPMKLRNRLTQRPP